MKHRVKFEPPANPQNGFAGSASWKPANPHLRGTVPGEKLSRGSSNRRWAFRHPSRLRWADSRLVFLSALVFAHLALPDSRPALAGEPSLADVRAQIPRFQTWLDLTGLKRQLEILRVRRTSHPDRSVSGIVFRLELRWRPAADTRVQAWAAFDNFDTDFAKVNGQRLGESLFYKFIQSVNLSHRSASVHVHVIDTDIATYLDREGELVTVDSVLRSVRAREDIPRPKTVGPAPRIAGPASATVPAAATVTPDWLLMFLGRHFASRNPNARFHQRGTEEDYVAFDVEFLRGEVIPDARYWERLRGDLYFLPRNGGLRLRLHLDGRFAAGGFGSRPPENSGFTDMEPRFTDRLTNYGETLVVKLRKAIQERRP